MAVRTITLSDELIDALARIQNRAFAERPEPDLYTQQESLLTAQAELTQHLLCFIEEQLMRAERAEEENERLMAALEVEKAWWECLRGMNVSLHTSDAVAQRLEVLTAVLEGKQP